MPRGALLSAAGMVSQVIPKRPVTATLLASGGTAGDNTSIVTGSVSWNAGDLLVAAININFLSGAGAWSASATGLRFDAYDVNTSNRMNVFVTKAAASGSGAVTLNANTFTSDAEAYQLIKIAPVGGGDLAWGPLQVGTDAAANAANSMAVPSSCYDADDYLLALTMLYNGNGDYTGQSGTPRSGWTEIGDTLGAQGGSFCGYVHSQISPQGGEATASISGMLAISNSRMLVLPIWRT